jgi:hypothetical protein
VRSDASVVEARSADPRSARGHHVGVGVGVGVGAEAAAKQRMARLTGKDTRGNERLARQHPRNAR